MNKFLSSLGLLSAFVLTGNAAFAQAPTVDGTRDASYPAALAVQTVETQFGDATGSTAAEAKGSELDNLHARIVGGNLYLFLGGNLQNNYNNLEIFFDSKSGGQNQLADNAQYLAAMNGLKFDAGSEADYALALACGTGALKTYANYAPLPTGSITSTAIGNSSTNLTQTLNFSAVVAGAGTGQAVIDNSNKGGVGGGTAAADVAAATAVSTGVEVMIPLTALGTTAGGGNIKIIAFINNPTHDYISNQVLPGAPAATGNFAVGAVDFTTVAGTQFVTVANGTTTATRGAGASAALLAAYPNPFSTSTTLSYELARSGKYALHVFSLSGQVVATQAVVAARAGAGTVVWNGRDAQGQLLAAGVYVAEFNGQHQRLVIR